jgi:hypothetical protein
MTDDAALSTPEAPKRRGRIALWGALAALAVAIGGVAVVAGGDDGGSLGTRRLPIALGSGGAGTAESRAAGPAADMAMVAYVHHTAGDDLPVLGGDGPAYRLRSGVDLDELRKVGRALGLDGTPVHEPEQKDSWTIRDGDRLLSATSYGGQWWYSSNAPRVVDCDDGGSSSSSSSGGGSSGGCAGGEVADEGGAPDRAVDAVEPVEPTCPPGGGCIDPMPVTTTTVFVPPADLPSKSEAQQLAADLFARAGVDLADSEVTVEGPYESWYVSFVPKVGGLPVSGYGFTANVGSKGEILDAAGVLGRPQDLGTYPTIDTRKAIDRLNDGAGFGTGVGRRGYAVDDLAVADATEGGAADADRPDPSTTLACPMVDLASDGGVPEPACAPTEPQPIEVVLHQAQRILVLIAASDDSGDTYLVPGYRMTGDDGQVVEVPSIDAEAILPTPTTTTPAPGAAECKGGTPYPEPGPNGEQLCSVGVPSAGGATPAGQ